MVPQVDEFARRSQNFGFLAPHEPLLVLDGIAAESYVYSDPNASLFKARRFGETLAKKLVTLTQTRVNGDTQHARLHALTNAGVLVPRIRQAFDQVRTTGNQAAHTHFGDVRAALSTVRLCFELGLWFYRAVSSDRAPRAFVPPPAPEAAGQVLSGAERADLEALQRELETARGRLAEVMLRRDAKATLLESEAKARAEAEQALARATADREQLQALIDRMNERLAEVEATFERQVKTPAKVSAAKRDAFIDRAQRAAREPLTEAEVRAEVDAMLTDAGWHVQDVAAADPFAGQGIAVREVLTATGPADYLLYVDRKLVGVIEAKREGQILSPVEAQSARYARSLTATQQLRAWRLPLPFRYETTAAETQFTNMLDPQARARQVFSFHQPTTLARWMREADADEQAPIRAVRADRGKAGDGAAEYWSETGAPLTTCQ